MQDSKSTSCVRALISGQVQGVGYRAATVGQARKLGINGWVRNLDDGRVEAVFEGEKATVEAMLRWCQSGPSAAVVEEVKGEEVEPTGRQGFEVR